MGSTHNDPSQFLRRALVDALKQRGEITDPLVESAFLTIPRHRFIPGVALEQAYANDALPVKRDSDGSVLSSISQPSMIAMMLEQLDLRPGDNVLEIGAGTGYNAMLMQHIVGMDGTVTAIELEQDVVTQAELNLQGVAASGQVRIVQGDGTAGYAPRAAYDRIISTVGVWDIPPAWVTQLKPKGVLVAPVWVNAMQLSAAFMVAPGDILQSNHNIPCGFIRLRGAGAGPNVSLRVGSSALVLTSNDIHEIDSAALQTLLMDDQEMNMMEIRLTMGEYWRSLLPYLILNLPRGMIFATYSTPPNEQAYGVSGSGFALMGTASVCLVPYDGHGMSYNYGSPDVFLKLQDIMAVWDAAGRPGSERLHLQIQPLDMPLSEIAGSRVYTRNNHNLILWQD